MHGRGVNLESCFAICIWATAPVDLTLIAHKESSILVKGVDLTLIVYCLAYCLSVLVLTTDLRAFLIANKVYP